MAKVVGDIVGVPNPKSDWNQTDETKADYIKNKPDIYTKKEVDAIVKTFAKNSGVEYGEGAPPQFSPEAVEKDRLYFDKENNCIYVCESSDFVEREGVYFTTWTKLHSSEAGAKNTMLFWKPDTQYFVGDQVFANIIESYEDYEKGIYKQVVLECIADHTSSFVEELWMFDEDMAAIFAERWNIKSDYEVLAAKDGKGNIISEYYASKEEIGDIEKALLEIEALADSLIGGDAE